MCTSQLPKFKPGTYHIYCGSAWYDAPKETWTPLQAVGGSGFRWMGTRKFGHHIVNVFHCPQTGMFLAKIQQELRN